MIIDIFYGIFASLALLCALANLFLTFYLEKDKVINNHKYDKWYKFHIIIQRLAWVLISICALLLIIKKFI
jgi:hypothetical protein